MSKIYDLNQYSQKNPAKNLNLVKAAPMAFQEKLFTTKKISNFSSNNCSIHCKINQLKIINKMAKFKTTFDKIMRKMRLLKRHKVMRYHQHFLKRLFMRMARIFDSILLSTLTTITFLKKTITMKKVNKVLINLEIRKAQKIQITKKKIMYLSNLQKKCNKMNWIKVPMVLMG